MKQPAFKKSTINNIIRILCIGNSKLHNPFDIAKIFENEDDKLTNNYPNTFFLSMAAGAGWLFCGRPGAEIIIKMKYVTLQLC